MCIFVFSFFTINFQAKRRTSPCTIIFCNAIITFFYFFYIVFFCNIYNFCFIQIYYIIIYISYNVIIVVSISAATNCTIKPIIPIYSSKRFTSILICHIYIFFGACIHYVDFIFNVKLYFINKQIPIV